MPDLRTATDLSNALVTLAMVFLIMILSGTVIVGAWHSINALRTSKTKQPVDNFTLDRRKLFSGGLLAFSSVALIQMIALNSVDETLSLALACFAISLPFSVIGVVICYFGEQFKYEMEKSDELYVTVFLVSGVSVIVATIAIFWHFASWIALLFMVSILLAYVLFTSWDKKIKSLNEDSE